jgi:diaminopimelate epimerase
VGNPHAVIFDAVADARVEGVVHAAEGRRDVWPHGVNVEFAKRTGDDAGARVRVHERGVGWTEACGTGACAVAAAMLATRGLDHGARWIDLDGGRLEITLAPDAKGELRARMRGPARRVFAGEVSLPGASG